MYHQYYTLKIISNHSTNNTYHTLFQIAHSIIAFTILHFTKSILVKGSILVNGFNKWNKNFEWHLTNGLSCIHCSQALCH